jgi:Fructose-bisphosphate aldolase class-II
MFVTKPRLFLAYVFENRFAVPSFNVSNLEMACAVIEAAELEHAPVMVQTDFINSNEVHLLLINLFGSIIHRETVPHRSTRPEVVYQDLVDLGRDSAALDGAALVFNGLFSVPDSSFLSDLA